MHPVAMQWSLGRLTDIETRMPDPSAWLSPTESERLAGLRAPPRRRQYLAGHWLAREMLSAVTGTAAIEGRLNERRSLAPAVVNPAGGLSVSISHTGDWVAAVAAVGPVGIDIELQGRVHRLHPLAAELAAVGEASQDLDSEQLLQRWVAKEAWIKASHGAALPGRIAAICLHPAREAEADVHLYRVAGIYLGLAGGRGHPEQAPVPASEEKLAYWRIEDHEAAS